MAFLFIARKVVKERSPWEDCHHFVTKGIINDRRLQLALPGAHWTEPKPQRTLYSIWVNWVLLTGNHTHALLNLYNDIQKERTVMNSIQRKGSGLIDTQSSMG